MLRPRRPACAKSSGERLYHAPVNTSTFPLSTQTGKVCTCSYLIYLKESSCTCSALAVLSLVSSKKDTEGFFLRLQCSSSIESRIPLRSH